MEAGAVFAWRPSKLRFEFPVASLIFVRGEGKGRRRKGKKEEGGGKILSSFFFCLPPLFLFTFLTISEKKEKEVRNGGKGSQIVNAGIGAGA